MESVDKLSNIIDRLYLLSEVKEFVPKADGLVEVCFVHNYYFTIAGENYVIEYLRDIKKDYNVLIYYDCEDVYKTNDYQLVDLFLIKVPNAKSDR